MAKNDFDEDTPLYSASTGTKSKLKGGPSKKADLKPAKMTKVAARQARWWWWEVQSCPQGWQDQRTKGQEPRPGEPACSKSFGPIFIAEACNAIEIGGDSEDGREEAAVKPSLFVATPAFGGLATVQYMRSILELWPVLAAAGIDVSWNVTVDSLVTRARNELVARFLRSEATHLFFVDSDIGFTPEQVLEMLRFNEPFVAGVYPLKALPLSGVGKKLEPCERRGRFVENFVGPSSCS